MGHHDDHASACCVQYSACSARLACTFSTGSQLQPVHDSKLAADCLCFMDRFNGQPMREGFHLARFLMQIGGSDQMGNILTGLDLIRRASVPGADSCYGLCFPLLTRTDGSKMGKSAEGAVWLSPGLFLVPLVTHYNPNCDAFLPWTDAFVICPCNLGLFLGPNGPHLPPFSWPEALACPCGLMKKVSDLTEQTAALLWLSAACANMHASR